MKKAFTLAEVLITLGIIGVVAAVALPALLTNIQDRVQKEQLRSVKYKLTLATDKMKSLGLLDSRYNTSTSTQDFVKELSKHLKIMKTCDNNHLSECWPTSTIALPNEVMDGSNKPNVNDIKNGRDLKALAIQTATAETMGIVTADGTPMILVYSPECTPLDAARTYTWSTVDNKPETNATTNCISAIIDINGKKGPNRLGKDVRTLNSLYGSKVFDDSTFGTKLSYSECLSQKNKLGIKECFSAGTDHWGGAVKYCNSIGLHLPSEQTLALAAGSRYGRSDITKDTVIASKNWTLTNLTGTDYDGKTCEERLKTAYNTKDAICIDKGTSNNMDLDKVDTAGIYLSDNFYWSSIEASGQAWRRHISVYRSNFDTSNRSTNIFKALCIGD